MLITEASSNNGCRFAERKRPKRRTANYVAGWLFSPAARDTPPLRVLDPCDFSPSEIKWTGQHAQSTVRERARPPQTWVFIKGRIIETYIKDAIYNHINNGLLMLLGDACFFFQPYSVC